MQRIFYYEVATAIKDRPKVFQAITLFLVAFSLTIILIASISRLSAGHTGRDIVNGKQINSYDHLSSATGPIVSVKK